jgi:N-acetylneuraminate synthase
VALGARAIEKHFTDDVARAGPDHGFSMDPRGWRDMVERTRDLEAALGDMNKAVAENERETVVLQRRAVRAARGLKAGQVLASGDLEPLRPAPEDAIFPYDLPRLVGRVLTRDLSRGEHLRWEDVGGA